MRPANTRDALEWTFADDNPDQDKPWHTRVSGTDDDDDDPWPEDDEGDPDELDRWASDNYWDDEDVLTYGEFSDYSEGMAGLEWTFASGNLDEDQSGHTRVSGMDDDRPEEDEDEPDDPDRWAYDDYWDGEDGLMYGELSDYSEDMARSGDEGWFYGDQDNDNDRNDDE